MAGLGALVHDWRSHLPCHNNFQSQAFLMSAKSSRSTTPAHPLPSYLDPQHLGPWGIYLQQIDRVTPYLGPLARWVETLKRP